MFLILHFKCTTQLSLRKIFFLLFADWAFPEKVHAPREDIDLFSNGPLEFRIPILVSPWNGIPQAFFSDPLRYSRGYVTPWTAIFVPDPLAFCKLFVMTPWNSANFFQWSPGIPQTFLNDPWMFKRLCNPLDNRFCFSTPEILQTFCNDPPGILQAF